MMRLFFILFLGFIFPVHGKNKSLSDLHLEFSDFERFFRSAQAKEKIYAPFLKDHQINLTHKELKIPKIIHQIWLGSPLPKKFEVMTQTWKDFHPDWQYILWTEDMVSNLENQKLYESAKNYGMKSDILRYEILKRFGGVYVDIDYECLKPLDPIHETGLEFYACKMLEGEVSNAFIGVIPNHFMMRYCVEELKKVDPSTTDFQKIIESTGPHLITRAILYAVLNQSMPSDWAIFHENFCFPMPSSKRFDYWNGKMSKKELFYYKNAFNSYAIHYWATSWQK